MAEFARVGAAIVLAAFAAAPLPAQTKAVRFGTLVDGTGRVLSGAVVVIDRDRVTAVGSAAAAVPPVRDLGASEHGDIALRELIDRGAMTGPRMFVAGYGLQRLPTPLRPGAPSGVPRGRIADTSDIAAGVKFAMGSDAVFTMFGQNTRELEWFVRLGMTPAQALATATTNAAALLGKEKELGEVAPGFFADLIAVGGNPLADIGTATRRVRWVTKGGTVVVDHR